jgi:AcrR family transcriptional regulator
MTAVEQQPPRRTRMSAARRRESILAAAAEVFAVAGYHAAKVSDIAARVGVTEPVVFQNFGSKPALFAAVLERTAGQARASLEDAATRFGSAGGLLAHVLGHVAPGHSPAGQAEPPTGHDDHGAAPSALFAVAVALAADPAVPEMRGPVLRALTGHLTDIVRRGQHDGSIRADIDPEPAAWLLVSVLATRPLYGGAMPADQEPAIAELAASLLSPRLRRSAACSSAIRWSPGRPGEAAITPSAPSRRARAGAAERSRERA